MKWELIGTGLALIGVGITLMLALPPPWWPRMPSLAVHVGVLAGLTLTLLGAAISIGGVYPDVTVPTAEQAWLFFFGIIFLAASIRWYVATSSDANKIINSTDYFFVRTGPVLAFEFPAPLIYLYDGAPGQLLAPIGIVVALEITNIGASATRISSYVIDAKVGDEWIRIPNLNPLNLNSFYWANDGNLATSIHVDFSSNSLDLEARSSTLLPGHSIRGSVFLEWPIALRNRSSPVFESLRISIENSQGKRQELILDSTPIQGAGESALGPGISMFTPGSKKLADLSQIPVVPLIDLKDSLNKGGN